MSETVSKQHSRRAILGVAFCWLTVAFGVALRALGLDKEPWFDEFQTVLYSKLDLRVLGNLDWPPFHFVLYGVLGGAGDIYRCRLISTGIAAILLCFLSLVFLRNYRRGAHLGLIFVATAPYLLRYGVEARGYGLLVLLTALATAAFVRLEQKPNHQRSALSLVMCVSLASLTHGVGVFLGPVFAIGLLLCDWSSSFYRRVGFALIILPTLVTIAWMVMADMGSKLNHTNWIAGPSPVNVIQSLLRLGVGFTDSDVGLFRGQMEFSQTLSVICLVLTVLLLLAFSNSGQKFLTLGFLYLAATILFSVFFKPVLLTRTLLPLTVFLAFFLAASAQEVKKPSVSFTIFLLMTIFASCSSYRWVSRYAGEPIQEFQEAVDRATPRIGEKSILVIGGGSQLITNYYFSEWGPQDRVSLEPQISLPEDRPVIFVAGTWMLRDEQLELLDMKTEGRQKTVLHSSGELTLIYFEKCGL